MRHQGPSAVLALFLLLFTFAVPGWAEPMKTETLTIETADGRSIALMVELAVTQAEREHGLMGRNVLADGAGMLFDFGQTRPVYMWMRNTLIPLDMLFIDASGRIVHIAENTEPMSEAIIDSRQEVRFVLEIAGGESGRMKIAVGDRAVSAQIWDDAAK